MTLHPARSGNSACYPGRTHRWRTYRGLVTLSCIILAACGGSNPAKNSGVAASVECAPFARALTGVRLSGAAADWWPQAKNRYTRTQRPEVGSILVFRRSGRLPSGHVGVVSQIISQRRITLTQANWVHHRVTVDQPVIDISERGDWSTVQVWWPPTGQIGTTAYPTFGFIQPDYPMNHDRLAAATPTAIRSAENGW
jgi:hypothetical protein